MVKKRRKSPQQKQENVSRKQFEEFLEQHDWGTYDISPDFGEDVLVQVYENGISTGISFYVQLKSVDTIQKHMLQAGEISYQFEVDDLEHWEAQATTVILAVWDVQQKRGWWIWINDAVEKLSKNNPEWRSKKKVNVHIDPSNEFNVDSLKRLRKLLANLYYPIVSKGKDLTIQASFKFPMTSEGKEKYAELKKHFATGDEVEVSGEYIDAFEFPEWWTRLYGERVKPPWIKIGLSEPKKFHPAQIEFFSSAGDERIPYVELWNIKQGKEEVTLSNEPQNIPLKFSIVLHKEAHYQNTFSFGGQYSNSSNDMLFQILKIQKILAFGGSIRITFLDIGNVLVVPVSSNNFPAPSQRALDFVEKVCFIEKNMDTGLNFPDDMSFTHEDVESADELISIIKNGSYRQEKGVVDVEFQKQGIVLLLEKYNEGSSFSTQTETEESYVDILTNRINLGPMIQEIKGNLDIHREAAKTWCEQAKDEDTFVVRVVNAEVFEEFEMWKK